MGSLQLSINTTFSLPQWAKQDWILLCICCAIWYPGSPQIATHAGGHLNSSVVALLFAPASI